MVHISLDTDDSIEEEYAAPVPVELDTQGAPCKCPEIRDQGLEKIAETSYKILKKELELSSKMEQSQRGGRKRAPDDRSNKTVSVTGTMEGGQQTDRPLIYSPSRGGVGKLDVVS